MASSPASPTAAPMIQTTIDEVSSRNGGTKRRRHPRPAAASVPIVPAGAADASDLQQHVYQLLVRHLDQLEQARNERDEARHAELLAAISAVQTEVLASISAFRSEVLDAIAALCSEVLDAIADLRRLLHCIFRLFGFR